MASWKIVLFFVKRPKVWHSFFWKLLVGIDIVEVSHQVCVFFPRAQLSIGFRRYGYSRPVHAMFYQFKIPLEEDVSEE